LLYYEDSTHIQTAIAREKQLKRWRREWKMEMIKKENPEVRDLAADWYS
jgi:putative endonuclease